MFATKVWWAADKGRIVLKADFLSLKCIECTNVIPVRLSSNLVNNLGHVRNTHISKIKPYICWFQNHTAFRTVSANPATQITEQGILKNVSTLQAKKRPPRKKRVVINLEEQATREPGFWNVVAYATAEEYNLERLREGLVQQDLYKICELCSGVGDVLLDIPDVIHATAKYEVGTESREMFFFREGTVVLWNISELESSNVLSFVKMYEDTSYDYMLVQDESEVIAYTRCSNNKHSHLKGGKIVLTKGDAAELDRYTFSNGLSLSVKLGVLEASLDRYVDSIEHVSEDLKQGRPVGVSREEVLRKAGELLALRHLINLSSDLLDTPDFYWDHEPQEALYQQVVAYLSIARRTRIMNERLNHCVELVELLSSHLSDSHHTRLEWMIIILIMVEVAFEIIHYVEKWLV